MSATDPSRPDPRTGVPEVVERVSLTDAERDLARAAGLHPEAFAVAPPADSQTTT